MEMNDPPAVLVDAVEQNFAGAQMLHRLCELHGIYVAPLAAALHGALPPAVALAARPGPLRAHRRPLRVGRVRHIHPARVNGDHNRLRSIRLVKAFTSCNKKDFYPSPDYATLG